MGGKLILFLLALLAIAVADEMQERIWLEDLNSDHDRRHLNAGLPSSLKFNLKRQSGDVELTLEENANLNLAAPVYELERDSNGKIKLHKRKTEPLTGVGFYHDKRNLGSFSVKCETVARGPCARMLTGNFFLDGRSYEIKPEPEVAYKRGFDILHTGTPHTLTENKRTTMSRSDDALLNLDLTDFLEDAHLNKTQFNVVEKRQADRQKRAKTQYAAEIFVIVDPTVWNNYLEIVGALGGETSDGAMEIYLRERFSHVLNGVSLMYKTIEHPEMEIYCTIIGFLFFKDIDSTDPLPTDREVTKIGSRELIDSHAYLLDMQRWWLLENLQIYDHIMTFTNYELYKDTVDNPNEGITFQSGACSSVFRIFSVVRDQAIFATTQIAAHELGHNLGAYHDGEWDASACDPDERYIMSPGVFAFRDNQEYLVNPWRFSQCSIDSFKSYIDSGRGNCLTSPGDYWNHGEFSQYTKKLPGEVYDADTQCKLAYGVSSSVCASPAPTDEDYCRIMKCLDFIFCLRVIAADGTACGAENSDTWCIEGQCVEKTVITIPTTSSPAPTTTTTSTTTPSPTTTTTPTTTSTPTPTPTTPTTTLEPTTSPQCAGDVGLDGLSCSQLEEIYKRNKVCNSFAQECCGTCGPICQGNKDVKIRGTTYSCETALTDVLGNSVPVLCRIAGKNCCEICT